MSEHINQDQTDLKKRELDAMCVNESQLSHPWFYNLKYLVVGVFLEYYLSKQRLSLGIEYRKCSGYSLFICMGLLAVPLR